jgi:hypothetical protein
MGNIFSTKNKGTIPPPLPLPALLNHVNLKMHPLNQYLLASESRNHVPLLPRSNARVRLLTFNMCLVPVCFTPLIYAPYQA